MFYFLSLAAALLSVGIYGLIVHKSVQGKVLALFSILNGVVVNLAAFGYYIKNSALGGLALLVFVITISAILFLTAAFLVLKSPRNSSESESDSIKLIN